MCMTHMLFFHPLPCRSTVFNRWGIFLTCAPGFSSPWHYMALASPVTVMLLLRFVSGVPPLEKMAEQRWGSSPEFQEYKARTNLLLPIPRLFKDMHTS